MLQELRLPTWSWSFATQIETTALPPPPSPFPHLWSTLQPSPFRRVIKHKFGKPPNTPSHKTQPRVRQNPSTSICLILTFHEINMPPKKNGGASVEASDGTAAGAVTALVSSPNVPFPLSEEPGSVRCDGSRGRGTRQRCPSTGFFDRASTELRISPQCHLIMSCDEFKADNAKLAPSKWLSREPSSFSSHVKSGTLHRHVCFLRRGLGTICNHTASLFPLLFTKTKELY